MSDKPSIKFDKTMAAVDIILTDIKRVQKVSSIVLPIFMIAYYIYALVTNLGATRLVVINSIFLALLAIDFVVVCAFFNRDKHNKPIKKKARRIIGYVKHAVKLVAAGFAIYEIVANEQNALETIFALVAVVAVVLQIIIDVITLVIERYSNLIITGFKQDVEEFNNSTLGQAVDAIQNPLSFALEKASNAISNYKVKKSGVDVELLASSIDDEKSDKTLKNENALNERALILAEQKRLEKNEKKDARKDAKKERFELAKQNLKKDFSSLFDKEENE